MSKSQTGYLYHLAQYAKWSLHLEFSVLVPYGKSYMKDNKKMISGWKLVAIRQLQFLE